MEAIHCPSRRVANVPARLLRAAIVTALVRHFIALALARWSKRLKGRDCLLHDANARCHAWSPSTSRVQHPGK